MQPVVTFVRPKFACHISSDKSGLSVMTQVSSADFIYRSEPRIYLQLNPRRFLIPQSSVNPIGSQTNAMEGDCAGDIKTPYTLSLQAVNLGYGILGPKGEK